MPISPLGAPSGRSASRSPSTPVDAEMRPTRPRGSSGVGVRPKRSGFASTPPLAWMCRVTLGVGPAVAVEVDRLAVEVDVDVAIPGDPGQRRPVVGVRVHERRRRIVGARVLVGPMSSTARAWSLASAARGQRQGSTTPASSASAASGWACGTAGGPGAEPPCGKRRRRRRREHQDGDESNAILAASHAHRQTCSLTPAPCWRRWRRSPISPFRTVCEELGAGLTFTEFLSADALTRGAAKALGRMWPSLGGRRFGVQIFGREPDALARAAGMAVDIGAASSTSTWAARPSGWWRARAARR